MTQIRVILADDHSMVREGIKQLLELDGKIEVVGQASNGEECLECISSLDYDVLLLDLNMPGMSGFKTLDVLKKKNNVFDYGKIIVLTIHNEIEFVMKAIEYKVGGYVLKDSSSVILKDAINIVSKKKVYIDPILVPRLKERVEDTIKTRNSELTTREEEILSLLAEGLLNREIALRLFISEKTVKNHVSNIFKKIGVSDRTQAAVYAIKHNFVQL